MEFTGQANAKELAEVFEMVASSSRAGRLTVTSGDRRLSFYFSPEGVTLLSDGGIRSTELAAELVAGKTISPQEAGAALDEQERTGGYLGEILSRAGAVLKTEVEGLVFRQIQDEILTLCTWEEGEFEFSEGELSPEVRDQFRFATNFTFNPHQLLMEAARRLDEWRRVEEHIPSDDAIFMRVGGAEDQGSEASPPEGGESLPASDTPEAHGPDAALDGSVATAVWVLVDGTRTVGEIIRDTHFSRLRVLACLAEFLEKGLIRPAEVEEIVEAARALARQQESARAARVYTHLAALRPGDAVMPLKAGQLYERLGQTAQALPVYRMAVERLLASDMPGQALGVVDVMKTLDPDDLFALATSVNVRLAAGDVEQAATDARHLAGLLGKRGEPAKALKYAAIVAELVPGDLSVRRTLAGLLVQAGRPSEAADELEKLAAHFRARAAEGGPSSARELQRLLREIEGLDPGRPMVRRALRGAEGTSVARSRRWGRTAAISAAAGLVLAVIAFAVIYEIEGRRAFRAVQTNADDLARHHRYDEAAGLFAEVARQFRYSSVADDAERSRRDLIAQGRRHAADGMRAGISAADAVFQEASGALSDLADQALARTEAAADWAGKALAAAALYAQARRFESQAKYAEARALYARLIEEHPNLVTYWNVELPLAVESAPMGAKVFINGKEVGRTPLLVRYPPFAAYRIVIQQPGFEPYEATLEPNAEVKLGAELGRRPQWVFRTSGAIEAGAACDGERVYVGSRDGHVYAVAAQTGHLVWKFDTGALGDVTCTPVIAGGTLFVGSHDHHVYALDSVSGQRRWQFRTGRLVRSSPCVLDRERLVCVGSFDRFVYALSAETGTVRWHFRTDGPVASTPVAYGDLVLVGSQDRRLYALEAASGALRWRFDAGGAVGSAPAVADGVIYFGADDGYLYALDGDTATIRWSFKTGGPIEGPPLVHGSAVYVGSSDGAVYALDAARGAVRWKYRTEGGVCGAPAVDGRRLCVGSEDQCLHVLDLAAGSLRWKARTGGPLAATPIIVGDLVFIGSRDGNLYAFRLSDQPAGPVTAALEGRRAE